MGSTALLHELSDRLLSPVWLKASLDKMPQLKEQHQQQPQAPSVSETTITEWSLLADGIRTTDMELAHAFDSTSVKSVRTSNTALMVTRKSSTRRTPQPCTRTLPETPTHGVRTNPNDVLGTGTTINSQDMMPKRGSIASIPSTTRSGPMRNSLMSQLLEQLTLVATRLLSLQAP